jgi:predicted O-linked N-acetylglucosamine transferase (SPINDLY family)
MATIPDLLALAVQQHQAGNLSQAEQLYRQVLQANPAHPDALHLLGMLAHQAGQPQAGVDFLLKAVAVAPQVAEFHATLAAAYGALGQVGDAIAAWRQVVSLRPDAAQAHFSLGNALNQAGRLQEAAASFQNAVRFQPDLAEARNNLGLALAAGGRLEDAITCYREVLRTRPELPEPYYNLGNAYLAQGRLPEAIASYEQALRLRPQYAEVHSNLGNVLRGSGRLDEAVTHCREALRLQPDLPEAHNNLGNALRDQNRLDEAIACYQAALRLRPAFAEVHYNLGVALTERGELPEAETCLREAVRLQPGDLEIHSRLLFNLNYNPELTPADLFAEHRRWAEVCGTGPTPVFAKRADPHRRLRIGYVSPDLHAHPVASFVEPFLRHQDAAQFEVFCYADVPRPDVTTERLRSLAHVWRHTWAIPDAQLMETIRADSIDILVDLAGHTPYNRLPVFAWKPAPIQITYLGYPNTSGHPALDYRLTDPVADPPGEPVCHSEELWRLPGCFCCHLPREDAPAVMPLPARSTGYVTFGSVHGLAKMNARVLDLWARLLAALPTARLLLFRHSLIGVGAERILAEFQQRGVLRTRIGLRNQRPRPGPGGHLSVYGDMDVALDTFPVSGHTTTCEAVWMGVPVLTLWCDRYAGRVTSSLLTQVGLEEWIARTPDEFVERGVRLATDLDGLAALRSSLRERMAASPLCDGPAFTHGLEQAYREMWRRWCARGINLV